MPHTFQEASGASIRPGMLEKNQRYSITDFGAVPGGSPQENTAAINRCLSEAAGRGGGTVVIPAGVFPVYTILLQSNVNLYLEENAVLSAARTDILSSYEPQTGEGGNYCEPEINPYVGLQDHGHSYFANSLIYGADLENIMIYGKGLFTGGRFDAETGLLEYVLQGGDPPEPHSRRENGHRGEWFGNKGIALVRCRNIVLQDFSITIGGHFAIITEGCENLYVNQVLVDTTRDAFDIDCCRNVTVLNTVCNSLTDDGLCLKASFGAGIFMPLENVLIEDCVVSGYDAGSVYAGTYTRDKLVAQDRCGPTGRVKFGTESTCGYHRVTIRRVKFDRSRGFALEAVDCSSLTDVLFEDCTLDNVSSSPIFIRAGDRGRFPVTGHGASDDYPAKNDIRLDNPGWVLPNAEEYHRYPALRYTPHYNRTRTVTVDGCSSFQIVEDKNPVQCNPANYEEIQGHFYLKTWDQTSQSYQPDLSREIPQTALPLYANGVGCGQLARISNVVIRNVRITNADPRYPILLMGLTDSHLKNITLENISVEYRGGLTLEHAVEQRQLNTEWQYSQFHARERVQNLPWLVNTFFVKNEGLLPRVDWDPEKGSWKADPYNVPELPEVYPEPSNWGILPAYGLFAKHVDGLTLRNISLSCKVPEGRHVCVFDDAYGVLVEGLEAFCRLEIPPIVSITHHYRRHTNAENVPEQPYFTTRVTDLQILQPPILHAYTRSNTGNDSASDPGSCVESGDINGTGSTTGKNGIAAQPNNRAAMPAPKSAEQLHGWVKEVEIHAPAPGTPRDSLYGYPTVPCQETGYTYPVATDDYPLPLTVHRPFLQPTSPAVLTAGTPFRLALTLRNPATEVSEKADDGIIYNEATVKNYSVKGAEVRLTVSCQGLPEGACFDREQLLFTWTPAPEQIGEHTILFTVEDGLIPEHFPLKLTVRQEET